LLSHLTGPKRRFPSSCCYMLALRLNKRKWQIASRAGNKSLNCKGRRDRPICVHAKNRRILLFTVSPTTSSPRPAYEEARTAMQPAAVRRVCLLGYFTLIPSFCLPIRKVVHIPIGRPLCNSNGVRQSCVLPPPVTGRVGRPPKNTKLAYFFAQLYTGGQNGVGDPALTGLHGRSIKFT
jgi:hypothetical protein